MSLFERLDRVTSRLADRSFSVRFHCHPATSTPNGRSKPDPDREQWEGKGILDENPAFAGVEIGNRDRAGNDLNTVVTGQQFELSVDRHRFPASATAKKGDLIQLDDLRGFAIGEIKPDGMARIVFGLRELR